MASSQNWLGAGPNATARSMKGRRRRVRDAAGVARAGRIPKAPSDTPCDEEQGNLTDPDSGLMRKSRSHEFPQCFNAQAAVDAEGSQLVVPDARIARNASERNELVASVDAIPPALPMPETVLADNGYANGSEVAVLQGRGVGVLVATCAEGRRRRPDFRPKPAPRTPPTMRSAWMLAMRKRLEQPETRRHKNAPPIAPCLFGHGAWMYGVELYAAVRHRPSDGEEDGELFAAAGLSPDEAGQAAQAGRVHRHHRRDP